MDGKWFCYGTAAARAVFDQSPDNYLNAVTCYVGEDGKLRLGLRMSGVTWDAAWVVYDNFQVEYLGADNMDGAYTALDALLRDANAMLSSDTLTTQEAKDALTKAIEAANAVADLTPELYEEHTVALNAAIKLDQEAISAAAALNIKVTNHKDKMSGVGEGSYEEYVGTEGYDELERLVGEILDNKLSLIHI